MHVGIREIKNRLSQYLSKVKQGETVIITERNVPVAKIVPYMKQEMEEVLHLQETGLVTWHGGKPGGMNNPPVVKGNVLISEIIAEDRR